MRTYQQSSLRKVCWAALALAAATLLARADELTSNNGERFTGKVIQETPDAVIFESELAGRMTIPRARIRELQRTPSTGTALLSGLTNQPFLAVASFTNAAASTNLAWRPPAVGRDGADWLQLKSGEWLRGHLKYIQGRKVEFDSDELEDLSLKLKDVRQLYPSEPLFAQFYDRERLYGTVVISNNVVQVSGPEQVSLPREQLTGITPGGKHEVDFWSGRATFGLNLQSGNTRQVTESASAELSRRTPATVVQLNYLGNFSEVNGEQNANNHRIDGFYDVRLNRDWFVRPAQVEYYRDQLANLDHRETLGVGVGYYFFDRDGLEWQLSGGPGCQFTRYETVEAGAANSTSAAAAVMQTTFKADITRRLKFLQTYSATLTSQQAGLYSHHVVSELEFEIKRHLELDVSLVWDYLQYPQTESDGNVPLHSDFRLIVGAGFRF